MSMKTRVDKAVKEVTKEMLHHFKKDGWPLDAEVYFSDVAYKALGVDYAAELWSVLNKKGISLVVKDGQAQFVKAKNDKRRKAKR